MVLSLFLPDGSSTFSFAFLFFAILDAARRDFAQHGSAVLYLGELHRQLG